jgi:hypothetical protein
MIGKVNPLSYEVSALRWLLIGIPANLPLDTRRPRRRHRGRHHRRLPAPAPPRTLNWSPPAGIVIAR